ncbi:MAG: hypothetical protein ABJA74_00250 [Lapillicoccus sp.]
MSVAAWVDGDPIDVADVEARLGRLRSRYRASALPADGTREGRQLRRWVAQVAVVERLCERELRMRGTDPEPRLAGEYVPTRANAAALGSIVAAAWANSPAVALVAEIVTRDARLSAEASARAARLGAGADGIPVWSEDDLLRSARMEAFARWLACATHQRVRLEAGFEHPGDAEQPDNLHEH